MSILLNPYRLSAGGASNFSGSITTGVQSNSWTEFVGGEGGEGHYEDHYAIDKGFAAAGLTTIGGAIGSLSSSVFAGKTISGCYTEDIDGVVTFTLLIAISGSPLGAGAVTNVKVGSHTLTGLSYYNTGLYEQWYLSSPPTLFGSAGDVVSFDINV